ncbi:MAG: histidinol dehydrogenase, partial [Candidatus Limnocylindrales bacterium]
MTGDLRLRRLDLRAPDAATLATRDALFRRGAVPDPAIREAARAILADVRARGSAAVREASARFGGGRPDGRLLIDRAELAAAAGALAPAERDALETAIANVRRFAEAQRPASTRTTIIPGVELERRWLPLARVGAYVPGGSAPYPSSLVMTVVPARVAGVDTIVVASPADRNGEVHPVLLGAAGLLGVDALLVAGGVQAIGALTYGLPEQGLEPVDLIVGPGSAWVTAAKIEVVGEVGIDLP